MNIDLSPYLDDLNKDELVTVKMYKPHEGEYSEEPIVTVEYKPGFYWPDGAREFLVSEALDQDLTGRCVCALLDDDVFPLGRELEDLVAEVVDSQGWREVNFTVFEIIEHTENSLRGLLIPCRYSGLHGDHIKYFLEYKQTIIAILLDR